MWLLTKASARAFGAFCSVVACSVSNGRAVGSILVRFERFGLVAESVDIVDIVVVVVVDVVVVVSCCCCWCSCWCC